jgi:uncharacterized protein YjiS (DUF1127 family)
MCRHRAGSDLALAPAELENGAMDLLHRLRDNLAIKRRELDTIHLLIRLNERSLCDLGLTREEIRPVAKLAARAGRNGVQLPELIARTRQAEAGRASALSRLLTALARAGERIAAREQITEYQPREVERLMAEAHRARDEAVADLLRRAWRGVHQTVGALVGPLAQRIVASETFRRLDLARLRRREFLQLRRQLASYSDRELMADLRLVRSEIDDVAADGAQRLVDSIARNGRQRRSVAWSGEAVGVGQPQG